MESAIKDFIKAFSCSYAIAKHLGRAMDLEEDDDLLKAVVGFSAGVSTMGDTCGTVNGGVAILGRKYSELLPAHHLYAICSEYYSRLESRTGVPDCGLVHGGRHLTGNFRRSILTGTTVKCMTILSHASDILKSLAAEVEANKHLHYGEQRLSDLKKAADHFEKTGFHCAGRVVDGVAEKTGLNTSGLDKCAAGFCGGIGFNGTLCGAICGGVLCVGLNEGVNLGAMGFLDTIRLGFNGLIESSNIFKNEKKFIAAKVFNKCINIYKVVENRYGGTHCRNIIKLDLSGPDGIKEYINRKKIDECEKICKDVAAATVAMIKS